jgi:uncharacterized Zn finger protein
MDTRSLPNTTTREQRGIALYRDYGEEVVRVYPFTYVVPSCTGATTYTVHLSPRERCDCPDFQRHHTACKHVYAAVTAAAKARARARARA